MELQEIQQTSHTLPLDKEPLIPVCVLDDQPHLDLKLYGQYLLEDQFGRTIFEQLKPDTLWRIRLDQGVPARFTYLVILQHFNDRKAAMEAYAQCIETDERVHIQEHTGSLTAKNQTVFKSVRLELVSGPYTSLQDAIAVKDAHCDRFAPWIVSRVTEPAQGSIEIFDLDYNQSATIQNAIKLVACSKDARVAIQPGKRNQGVVDRSGETGIQLQGDVDISLNTNARLQGQATLPLERLLQRLVPLAPPIPPEYLKTYMICLRGYILQQYVENRDPEPVYNPQNEVEVFAYADPKRTRIINAALKATRGKVLAYQDHLSRMQYSKHDGGISDAWKDLSGHTDAPYLTGTIDTPSRSLNSSPRSFTKSKDARKWINAAPGVQCNITDGEGGSYEASLQKGFRWKIGYNRQEMEEIIQKKSGEDIGTLYNIVPLTRTKTGRITELEILGSRKNLRLTHQELIRSVLAEHTLPSTCFVIAEELDVDGTPISFTISGAGSGPGVGICLAGAYQLARAGKTHIQILKFYYRSSKIKQLYS